MVSRVVTRTFAALFVASLLVLCWIKPAHAYAWMIRHDYTGCNQCHADPSGGGLMTPYGRAQSDFLLRMRYGAPESYEPPKSAEFLFGAITLPESVLLGGDVRYASMATMANGATATRFFFMQADVTGQVTKDRFRANASVGWAHEGARQAALTHADTNNLVSRLHWVGFDLGKDKNWLLRAGRMNLPFGVRSVEHTMWVRSATRTDINYAQQHGAALSYNGAELRGEIMLIAGNFQVAPDEFRERGYSGFLEYATSPHMAFGVSSLVARASRDPLLATSLTRHAHGAFARYNPAKPLVLMAEADFLINAPGDAASTNGYVAMLQADVEPTQGLHLIGTGELLNAPGGLGTATEAWGSVAWFFAPHADLRLDAIWQNSPGLVSSVSATTLLAQLHLFL